MLFFWRDLVGDPCCGIQWKKRLLNALKVKFHDNLINFDKIHCIPKVKGKLRYQGKLYKNMNCYWNEFSTMDYSLDWSQTICHLLKVKFDRWDNRNYKRFSQRKLNWQMRIMYLCGWQWVERPTKWLFNMEIENIFQVNETGKASSHLSLVLQKRWSMNVYN